MRIPGIMINEKIGIVDLVFKYTVRDTILGIARIIPASIGVIIRMWLYKIFLLKCGKGLTLKEYVVIKFPENIDIGEHVGISEFSWIDGNGGVSIGDYTRIGPYVSIVSFEHKIDRKDVVIKKQGKMLKKVTIGKDVWIGSSAVVLAGINIGDGAVVGAGAVVTTDVPPYGVVAGNPVQLIKFRGNRQLNAKEEGQ